MSVVATVCSWLLTFLPIIWWVASKAFPRIIPGLIALVKSGGVIGSILYVVVGIIKWVKHISIKLLAIRLGAGVLGKIFTCIRYILNFMFRFPIIAGITLVLSQVFPTLWERIFLIVGAVSLKIALMLFGNVMRLINDSAENNIDTLNAIIGESADQLPPCMVDVLGYMHVVEDIGLIISTLILIMVYNFVVAFAFKFVK